MKNEEKSIDLGSRKLVAMRDVQDALAAGATRIVTAANCVVTPSARDFLQQHGIELITGSAPLVRKLSRIPSRRRQHKTALHPARQQPPAWLR